MEGLEPPRLAALDPKSSVSTNFTTSACFPNFQTEKRRKDRQIVHSAIGSSDKHAHPAKVFTFAQSPRMPSFTPSELPVAQLHGLLLGAIGPRPIAFASTLDEDGRPNLAPFSFFNVFSANPPILIFSPARRGRDNTTKHTFENAMAVPEVVINIVSHAMVEQMSLASNEFDKGVNEFEKAGFSMKASDVVKPWRVAESPAQFECRINEVVQLGKQGGAGNLIICEVLRFHISDEVMNGEGKIDQNLIDSVGRMGGNWYVRAHGAALFEVAKPGQNPAIGFDKIPEDIRSSTVLSGNDLGQLGGVQELPDETEVNEWRLTELSELFVSMEEDPRQLEDTLHRKAAELLSEKKVKEAWLTLLSFNN